MSKLQGDASNLEFKWNPDGTWRYVDRNKKLPRGLRRFLTFLAVVAGLYLLMLVAVFFGQSRLIYFPNTLPPTGAASTFVDTATDITITTEDGLELGAWWVEPHNAVEARDQVILYAGGNGGNRENRSQLVFFFALRGFHVLSFDYRGYGGNPGTPSEEGFALDARAALAEIQARGFDAHKTIYFGESLGAAVVTRLASYAEPAALVLRSPFYSLPAVGQWHFPFLPVYLLLREHYPVAQLLAQMDVPVLVIYGTSDNVVPALQSLQVAEAARNLWLTVPFQGLGHNSPSFWGLSIAELVTSIGDAVRY